MSNICSADSEHLYNARAQTPGYLDIFQRWENDSAEYREKMLSVGRCELDIRYGDHPREKLDIFLPPEKPKGVVMYIHGGYWSSLDKRYASIFATPFVEAGYMVGVISYALCPEVKIIDIIGQVRKAAWWLYTHQHEWDSASAEIFACGHSAGGHLATMLITDYSHDRWPITQRASNLVVKGAISISGLYDLRPLTAVPSITKLTNIDLGQASLASPALYKPVNGAHLLTAVGLAENPGFQNQQELISAAWSLASVSRITCEEKNHFTVLDELYYRNGNIASPALKFISLHSSQN